MNIITIAQGIAIASFALSASALGLACSSAPAAHHHQASEQGWCKSHPASAYCGAAPKPAFTVRMTKCGTYSHFTVRNVSKSVRQWVWIQEQFISSTGKVLAENVTDSDVLSPGTRQDVTDHGWVVHDNGTSGPDVHPARCIATWSAEPGQPPVPQTTTGPTITRPAG